MPGHAVAIWGSESAYGRYLSVFDTLLFINRYFFNKKKMNIPAYRIHDLVKENNSKYTKFLCQRGHQGKMKQPRVPEAWRDAMTVSTEASTGGQEAASYIRLTRDWCPRQRDAC